MMIRGRNGSFVTGVIAIYSPFHSVSVSRFTVGGANFFSESHPAVNPRLKHLDCSGLRIPKKKRGGPPHLFQTVPRM